MARTWTPLFRRSRRFLDLIGYFLGSSSMERTQWPGISSSDSNTNVRADRLRKSKILRKAAKQLLAACIKLSMRVTDYDCNLFLATFLDHITVFAPPTVTSRKTSFLNSIIVTEPMRVSQRTLMMRMIANQPRFHETIQALMTPMAEMINRALARDNDDDDDSFEMLGPKLWNAYIFHAHGAAYALSSQNGSTLKHMFFDMQRSGLLYSPDRRAYVTHNERLVKSLIMTKRAPSFWARLQVMWHMELHGELMTRMREQSKLDHGFLPEAKMLSLSLIISL